MWGGLSWVPPALYGNCTVAMEVYQAFYFTIIQLNLPKWSVSTLRFWSGQNEIEIDKVHGKLIYKVRIDKVGIDKGRNW